MGLISKLSEFVVRTSFDDLPNQVIEVAKERILDTIGATLWGQHTGVCKPMISLVTEWGGNPEASVFGGEKKLPCFWASFLNGCSSAYMADSCRFSGMHHGIVVVPAALALGEREEISGKEFITAVVLGYETNIRIGRAIFPYNSKRGFHPTSTVGPFGAAAAASKIIGLNEAETSNALSLAGITGAGLFEAFKARDSARIQFGRASQSGVFSALLAQRGMKGSSTILEGGFIAGAKAFFDAFADKCNLETLTEGLGKDYGIPRVAIKIHDGVRHNHVPLDAVMELVHRHKLDAENIQEIKVKTYSEALRLLVDDPKTGDEARFSAAFCIATAILADDVYSDKFTTERLNDNKTRRLMAKVKVELDPELDKAYPRLMGAKAEILTKDGNSYRLKLDFPKGELENPLPKQEIEKKFRYLARPVLGSETTERVITLFNNLETIEKMPDLISLLHKPGTP